MPLISTPRSSSMASFSSAAKAGSVERAVSTVVRSAASASLIAPVSTAKSTEKSTVSESRRARRASQSPSTVGAAVTSGHLSPDSASFAQIVVCMLVARPSMSPHIFSLSAAETWKAVDTTVFSTAVAVEPDGTHTTSASSPLSSTTLKSPLQWHSTSFVALEVPATTLPAPQAYVYGPPVGPQASLLSAHDDTFGSVHTTASHVPVASATPGPFPSPAVHCTSTLVPSK